MIISNHDIFNPEYYLLPQQFIKFVNDKHAFDVLHSNQKQCFKQEKNETKVWRTLQETYFQVETSHKLAVFGFQWSTTT